MRYTYLGRDIVELTKQLQAVLTNVSSDNMKIVEVSGTTDATPNTAKRFLHNVGRKPGLVLVQEGNAYISKNGIETNAVWVASTAASQEFTLFLIF